MKVFGGPQSLLELLKSGALQPSRKRKTRPLKVGYLPITHSLALVVADNLNAGKYRNLNLELVKFSSWPELLDAIYLGDRVVVMSNRPGTIKRIVPVSLPKPRDRAGYEFVRIRKTIYEEFFAEAEKPFI